MTLITAEGDGHDALAFFQCRPVLHIQVEEMNLLVSLGNFPLLVDPEHSILHSHTIVAGLMDADMNGKLVSGRLMLHASDKLALLDGANKRQRFGSRGRNVITRLGKKEDLGPTRDGLPDEDPALLEIVGHAGRGCNLTDSLVDMISRGALDNLRRELLR